MKFLFGKALQRLHASRRIAQDMRDWAFDERAQLRQELDAALARIAELETECREWRATANLQDAALAKLRGEDKACSPSPNFPPLNADEQQGLLDYMMQPGCHVPVAPAYYWQSEPRYTDTMGAIDKLTGKGGGA